VGKHDVVAVLVLVARCRTPLKEPRGSLGERGVNSGPPSPPKTRLSKPRSQRHLSCAVERDWAKLSQSRILEILQFAHH
jgi:hypothetical protein